VITALTFSQRAENRLGGSGIMVSQSLSAGIMTFQMLQSAHSINFSKLERQTLLRLDSNRNVSAL
jgi:hypothetical protein